MKPDTRLVLYGNSVFLAGIKAQLGAESMLELIVVESDHPDTLERLRTCRPRAILFDLSEGQPDFAFVLLREQPGLLLVGVDPSSDALLVLSSQSPQALSVADLVKVINPQDFQSEPCKGGNYEQHRQST